jgi:ribonuclease BN (tRNA processing enzyme)
LAYLTDHEPARAADLTSLPAEWVSGYAIASGGDLLIHDCQYTEDEYPSRAGFGHSSPQHVADFARITGVRRLLLFHHDPNHGDAELEALRDHVRELWDGGDVELAREGDELEL